MCKNEQLKNRGWLMFRLIDCPFYLLVIAVAFQTFFVISPHFDFSYRNMNLNGFDFEVKYVNQDETTHELLSKTERRTCQTTEQ